MPNPKLTSPQLPLRGYRNESATTLTPGLGVIAGTAEDQVQVAGANAAVKGVVGLNQSVAQNGIVSVHIGFGGEVYVCSGAAFAVGARLTTNAAGKWVTCTTGQPVRAIAQGAAAGADELIAAMVQDGNTNAP